MYIRRTEGARKIRAYTLVEMMVGVALACVALAIVASFFFHASLSFAAMTQYADLERLSRRATDRLTAEVRQAKRVTGFTTNSVVLEDADGGALEYRYVPSTRRFVRIKNDVQLPLLTDCDFVSLDIRQRNPVGGTYDIYPVATPGTAKVLNVSWRCSRSLWRGLVNTESVHTARIVIRKQQ